MDKMDIIKLEKYEEKHIENIKKYITSLNESEIKALKIAEEHLETSFNTKVSSLVNVVTGA